MTRLALIFAAPVLFPDPAHFVTCLITVATVRHWRAVLQFMADCEDGNVERLEREEARAQEAAQWLRGMEIRRVG